jgi:hypothetical protein
MRARQTVLATLPVLAVLSYVAGGCDDTSTPEKQDAGKPADASTPDTSTPQVDSGTDAGAQPVDSGTTEEAGQDSSTPTGNLWVTDNFNGATKSVIVFATTANGDVKPVVTIGGANTTLTGPTCAAFDATGNLWVVDSKGGGMAGQLVQFPAASLVAGGNIAPSKVIAGNATTLIDVAGCAMDSNGALWVANVSPPNPAQNNVVKFSAQTLTNGGTVMAPANSPPDITLGSIGGQYLCNTFDLAFDGKGNLWVANLCSNIDEYQKSDLAASGTPTPIMTIKQATGVSGLAFDQAGNLWTTLQGSTHAATEFKAADLMTGDSGIVASASIIGPNTQMQNPVGIAIVGGNVWVAQQNSTKGIAGALTMYAAASLGTDGGNIAPAAVVSGTTSTVDSPTKIVLH